MQLRLALVGLCTATLLAIEHADKAIHVGEFVVARSLACLRYHTAVTPASVLAWHTPDVSLACQRCNLVGCQPAADGEALSAWFVKGVMVVVLTGAFCRCSQVAFLYCTAAVDWALVTEGCTWACFRSCVLVKASSE